MNSTLVINSDERGKHKIRPHRVPEKFKQVARDHLASFPVMDSHYCRENTSRKYLEKGLSINKMYLLFKEEMREKMKRYMLRNKCIGKFSMRNLIMGFLYRKKTGEIETCY